MHINIFSLVLPGGDVGPLLQGFRDADLRIRDACLYRSCPSWQIHVEGGGGGGRGWMNREVRGEVAGEEFIARRVS